MEIKEVRNLIDSFSQIGLKFVLRGLFDGNSRCNIERADPLCATIDDAIHIALFERERTRLRWYVRVRLLP